MTLDSETRLQLLQCPSAAIPPEFLSPSDNGIDFFNHPKNPGKPLQYENQCFEAILQGMERRSFAIGPHVIDHFLGRSEELPHGATLPDAIEFTRYSHAWVLSALYEFKSGKNHHTESKVRGFQKLITHLRGNPDFLPTLLRDPLKELVKVPRRIIIPDASQIDVVFILPKQVKRDFKPAWGFNLSYLELPFPTRESDEPAAA